MSFFLKQNLTCSQDDTREGLMQKVERLQEQFLQKRMTLKTFSCYYDSDKKKHIQVSLFESV